MKASLVLALAAALPALPAQDKPAAATAAQLPQLRAAFAAAKAGERAAIIAVVEGSEPVILTAGSDASGKDLTPQTLVPLLALAKVLAADAIYVQQKGEIDKGSGEKLGDRELTVRELLDGVTWLPNFYVLDGGDDAVDAALLRQCGAMAAGAKMELQGSALGASEFVLLEPLAFGERYKDWPSMLRLTLAPRVSGLDPVSADALGEQTRGCTLLAAEELSRLATARPALLRTMLSLQNIGTWLQWRAQEEAPLWTSDNLRMGTMMASLTQSKEKRWVRGCTALGQTVSLSQYPSRKAALLLIGPQGSTSLLRAVNSAFEGDVYPTGDEAAQGSPPEERLRGAAAAARAARAQRGEPAPSALDGTRWCSTTDDGKKTVRLAFGGSAKEPLALTLDGDPVPLLMTPMGEGLRANPIGRAKVSFSLLLRPEPDADKPTKLTCVLITSRRSGADPATAWAGGASVPQYFELVPEKN